MKNLDRLKKLGWNLYQTGPDEFEYLKFDEKGRCIAKQGDSTWVEDNS